MKAHTYLAITFLSLSTTVIAAPTPQLSLTNILGSITNPGAGNNNLLKGNGNNNSNENEAGSANTVGNGNKLSLKDRSLLGDGLTNTIGSITNPTAGSGNKLIGNGNGNGNGNSAGSGNTVGNANSLNVSPNVSPSIALPDISL